LSTAGGPVCARGAFAGQRVGQRTAAARPVGAHQRPAGHRTRSGARVARAVAGPAPRGRRPQARAHRSAQRRATPDRRRYLPRLRQSLSAGRAPPVSIPPTLRSTLPFPTHPPRPPVFFNPAHPMLYSRLRFASRLGCVVVASVVVALATASLPLKAAGLAEGDLPASLTSALVRVELLAQTSGGDQPDAAGWNQRCPNCGNYHDSALDNAFGDERPATSPGYLIAPDRVLTADPLVEDRFVREWRVRLGDEVVPARPIAWAADRAAMLWQLERPSRAAQPLRFAPTDADPHYTLHPGNEENGWSLWLEPYAAPGWLLQDGRRFRAMPDGALFLDATGRPLAVSMGERLPADPDRRAPHGPTNWTGAGR